MTGLEGARVLLTGASSGIGRELALVLAARGARLAIAARRVEALEEVAAQAAGHRPVVLCADLARRGAAQELAGRALEALGGIDVLVNNAGGGVGGQVWRIGDHDAAREAFEVNYWSPVALVGAVAPQMVGRGDGVIVNVTSLAQVSTWPGLGGYAATKAALATAAETLAMELAGTGVHVLEAIPGPVDTAVQGETRLAPGIGRMLDRAPLGDPREMAERIVRAIERRKARVIYPRPAAPAYHLPSLARRAVRRQAARATRALDPAAREAFAGLVLRTGSRGDADARAARAAWERERGRAM